MAPSSRAARTQTRRAGAPQAVPPARLTTWDWATLLQRVWGVDAPACVGCGGRMRLIAVIKHRAVIERILKHIGEVAGEPRFARARDPCDLWA
jgi:hypothetical protein